MCEGKYISYVHVFGGFFNLLTCFIFVDCQIDLCQECKIDNGDETCLLCEMGYALSSDATQCLDIETGSSKSIELYVLAEYNGYYVSDLSL